MRWLQKSSQAPQLLGLSPLKVDDSLTKSTNAIDLIEQKNELMTNLQQNQSARKSRKGKRIATFLNNILTCYANFMLHNESDFLFYLFFVNVLSTKKIILMEFF